MECLPKLPLVCRVAARCSRITTGLDAQGARQKRCTSVFFLPRLLSWRRARACSAAEKSLVASPCQRLAHTLHWVNGARKPPWSSVSEPSKSTLVLKQATTEIDLRCQSGRSSVTSVQDAMFKRTSGVLSHGSELHRAQPLRSMYKNSELQGVAF
eukprot:4832483-Pleurochrysis_carterae.AAC.2